MGKISIIITECDNMEPGRNASNISKIIPQILALAPYRIIIVMNNNSLAENLIESNYIDNNFIYVRSKKKLGTGFSIMLAMSHVCPDDNVVILGSDTPNILSSTLKQLYSSYKTLDQSLFVTGMEIYIPEKGKIITDDDSNIIKIDHSGKNQSISDCGIYITRGYILIKYVPRLMNNNRKRIYYFTDIVETYLESGERQVGLHILGHEYSNEI